MHSRLYDDDDIRFQRFAYLCQEGCVCLGMLVYLCVSVSRVRPIQKVVD